MTSHLIPAFEVLILPSNRIISVFRNFFLEDTLISMKFLEKSMTPQLQGPQRQVTVEF